MVVEYRKHTSGVLSPITVFCSHLAHWNRKQFNILQPPSLHFETALNPLHLPVSQHPSYEGAQGLMARPGIPPVTPAQYYEWINLKLWKYWQFTQEFYCLFPSKLRIPDSSTVIISLVDKENAKQRKRNSLLAVEFLRSVTFRSWGELHDLANWWMNWPWPFCHCTANILATLSKKIFLQVNVYKINSNF